MSPLARQLMRFSKEALAVALEAFARGGFEEMVLADLERIDAQLGNPSPSAPQTAAGRVTGLLRRVELDRSAGTMKRRQRARRLRRALELAGGGA